MNTTKVKKEEVATSLSEGSTSSPYSAANTLFMLCFLTVLLGSIPISILLVFFTPINFIFIPYLLYTLFDKSYRNGAKRSTWFRRLSIWSLLRSYFQSELITLAPFDPTRRYLIGYHPHGVLSFGLWSVFATDCEQFDPLLKNIKWYIMMLDKFFLIPFEKDMISALGFVDSNKSTIKKILSKKENFSCVLAVGGVAESFLATSERAQLILAKRYGFIKLALETGADLVPSYGFGENDCFKIMVPEPNSMFDTIQKKIKSTIGFVLPLFLGDGFLPNSLGLLPKRVPITVVIGKPIAVSKVENPTNEQVLELHKKYTESLMELYEGHKDYYANRVFELTGKKYNSPSLSFV